MESVFRKVEMWIGEELDYGPNGGLVFAMEYLSENMNWLEAWTSKQPVTKVEGIDLRVVPKQFRSNFSHEQTVSYTQRIFHFQALRRNKSPMP